MAKLFGMLMGVSIMLLVLACAPRAAPVAAPAPAAPQVASPLPAPVAPVLSAEEAAWQKVVEAAKKEGRVTLYSTITEDTALALTKGFRERTGLVVENITGLGGGHIERVKAERRAGNPVASLMSGDLISTIGAKMDGLFQRMGYIPSVADEAAWQKSPIYDGEGYIITSSLGVQSPWINTNLVKPGKEPRSWRDLLQPQWKGKIAIADPDLFGATVRMFYYLTKHGGLDEDYFRQLGSQAEWTINAAKSADKVARGEAHMLLIASAKPMSPFVLAGAPMKPIDLEEGNVILEAQPYTLFAQAPSPNAARLFVNFALSKEGQTLAHKASASQSLRKDVPNFEPPAGRLSPKRPIWTTPEQEWEVANLIRERRVGRIMKGQ